MGNKNSNISIFDSELRLKGVFSFKGRLIMKGSFEGKIAGENLVIAEEGVVLAEINAENVTIGGQFEGYITALNEVVILSTGICSGKISCKSLVVETGGLLNGDIRCTKDLDMESEKEPVLVGKDELT
ncbi:MAG: polymer-forming cytoskeletal protein [Desulfobacterales bacterium]|nr:polymer-forming cytoskeletal protein [Desulfobacterales bacterium]